jgi:hypothetical protein
MKTVFRPGGIYVMNDEEALELAMAEKSQQELEEKSKELQNQIDLCIKLLDRASGLIAVAHSELKSLANTESDE